MQSVFHSSSISQLIEKASKKIDRLDAQLLLAHVLKQPRAFLIAHGDEKIGKIDIWKFEKLVQKRKREIPLAYLTGHKEFFGLDFFVNTHTLIPRPDTEVMIEQVLEQITQSPDRPITYIDIGTGSGCIPIAIAQTLTDKRKQLKIFATDISRKALRVAKKMPKNIPSILPTFTATCLNHGYTANNTTIEQ